MTLAQRPLALNTQHHRPGCIGAQRERLARNVIRVFKRVQVHLALKHIARARFSFLSRACALFCLSIYAERLVDCYHYSFKSIR